MNKEEALEFLKSKSQHERLKAARFFSDNATIDDEETLRHFYEQENVLWIRKALLDALVSISSDGVEYEIQTILTENEEDLYNQAYTIAVEQTTRLLLHEIEPRIGMIRLAAKSDIEHYKDSRVWASISKLESLLRAIRTLSLSASSPKLIEFDLAELIEQIIQQVNTDHPIELELSGRSPMIIHSDPDLIEIVVLNGVRNALESMDQVEQELQSKIIVTWGDSDVEYTISILDRGVGLPLGRQRIFDIGSTTKKNHFGMGLPIAKQAATSLGGQLKLLPRENGGVNFDFRWPLLPGDYE